MPVINITMGTLTTETKKEIIQRVTETLIDITQLPPQEFTCIIHEIPYENLGRGTKTIKEIIEERSK